MKLQTKTNLLYFLFSIPILLIVGVVCYYLITYEIRDSNDELLLKRKYQIQMLLNENNKPALNLITQSGEAIISAINNSQNIKSFYTDTLIFDTKEDEPASYRMLVADLQTTQGAFQIRVWRSTIEFDELFEGILLTVFLILILMFSALLLVNNWVSKKLWKPFYSIVDFISHFSFSDNKNFIPLNSSVKEFKELNQSFLALIEKVNRDYASQKQFSENASHEMQTPLAVINTKVDLLIQSQNLSQSDTELIVAIDEATSKLIRVNKALLLLTKIENRQFIKEPNINIENIIGSSIELFHDYLESKNIKAIKEINDSPLLYINPGLCEVLVNNLLQNAIRHNYKNGEIAIQLNKNQLLISNTGPPLSFDADKIFNRFHKSESSSDSIGLGLAIAQEIAITNNFSLTYRFNDGFHIFTVVFN